MLGIETETYIKTDTILRKKNSAEINSKETVSIPMRSDGEYYTTPQNFLNNLYSDLNFVWVRLDIDITTAKNNKIIEIFAGVENAEEFANLSKEKQKNVINSIIASTNINEKILKHNRKEVRDNNDIGFFKHLGNFFRKSLDKKLGISENDLNSNQISEKVKKYLEETYGSFENMNQEKVLSVVEDIKEMLILSALRCKDKHFEIVSAIHAELSKYLSDDVIISLTEDIIKAVGLNSAKQALDFEKNYMQNIVEKNPLTKVYRSLDTAEELQKVIVKGLDRKGIKETSKMYQKNVNLTNSSVEDLKQLLANSDLTAEERQAIEMQIQAHSNFVVGGLSGFIQGLVEGNTSFYSAIVEVEGMINAVNSTDFSEQVRDRILTGLESGNINIDSTTLIKIGSLVCDNIKNSSINTANNKNSYISHNRDISNREKEIFADILNKKDIKSTDIEYENTVRNTDAPKKDEKGDSVDNKVCDINKDENNNADNAISGKDITEAELRRILNDSEKFYSYVKEEKISDTTFCKLVFSEKNTDAILQNEALKKFEAASEECQFKIYINADVKYHMELFAKMKDKTIEIVKENCCYYSRKKAEKYEQEQLAS